MVGLGHRLPSAHDGRLSHLLAEAPRHRRLRPKRPRSLYEGQFRRAKKALAELTVESRLWSRRSNGDD
ncbi:hypothetical protein QJS10_CPA06g00356 [Acorus calamus]|uniref:Uncharacterized protein n=1 Tax=Acorus calamus TaxID=4465 RepID=A0AAV9EKZ4_ACOCL|nr:hypothetical protein QJS10_CPA06g00356 [Acorus calamus]